MHLEELDQYIKVMTSDVAEEYMEFRENDSSKPVTFCEEDDENRVY